MKNNFGGLDLASQQQERLSAAVDELTRIAQDGANLTDDDAAFQAAVKNALRGVMAERKAARRVQRLTE